MAEKTRLILQWRCPCIVTAPRNLGLPRRENRRCLGVAVRHGIHLASTSAVWHYPAQHHPPGQQPELARSLEDVQAPVVEGEQHSRP
eukprot:CAMPEP_0180317072 /NCGR_PEP_ID=MMETSP0988-20121125/33627_1 /TAXON_ID=697907 /ORGANISM="non described non described, Strain CCMP2293" /LENGTH=86 /DNA_ID=CAMNT_0022302273 /DNA_START=122 /DNA_END=379 /DNA_ORIENTATION=+